MTTKHARWSPLVALLLVGCASVGGAGPDEPSSTFDEDMGRVMVPLLEAGLFKILPKYNLAIRRREAQFNTLYYETEWRPRGLTPAERDEGVVDARQRVVLRGRRTSTDPSGGGVFRVNFEAENEVRTQLNGSWHPAPAPDAFFDFWREVAMDLAMEIRVGVRRG
ncbi:MAG: hypothetical protein KY453_03420 [Gemmatimonadetes bacterium]|nr:hypothetical protein [Gemmatimonadota bacterium]